MAFSLWVYLVNKDDNRTGSVINPLVKSFLAQVALNGLCIHHCPLLETCRMASNFSLVGLAKGGAKLDLATRLSLKE